MIILTASQNKEALVFGLLGHNISYSLSPAMHNHYFAKHEIDAVYGLFDIDPMEFDSNAASLISGTAGFNITVPYKERIIPLLDGLSEEAGRTGSVNLVFGRKGYNTDYMALKRLIQPFVGFLDGRNCTIFGAGGAARTAAYLFGESGMNITIINRSRERAEILCAELQKQGISAQCEKFPVNPRSSTLKTDCVVNCTSSSNAEFPWIVAEYVVDFNYGNKSVSFRSAIRESENLISGEELLIQQAIYSQKLWNNGEPSFEELAEVIDVK